MRTAIYRQRTSSKSIALLIAGLLGMSAYCNTATADATADQSAASAQSTALEEIVVTAQRREQALVDVPMSVAATTGVQLTDAGVIDLQSLTEVAPQVSFQSNYSKQSTSFAIRGVESINDNGGEQPSVSVVMDDMPYARQGEVVMSLADIDHVEVLSGPQGTLFGKNATAGVVNIVQKRPDFTSSASLDYSGTTDGELFMKGLVNEPVNDWIAARVNTFYDNVPGEVRNFSGYDVAGQREYGIQSKLLFDFSDRVNLLVTSSYNYFWESWGSNIVTVPNSGALGALQLQYITPFSQDNETVKQDNSSFDRGDTYSTVAALNVELSDHLKLTSITGYRRWADVSASDVDAGPTGVNAGTGEAPGTAGYPINTIEYPDQHESKYSYWSQEVRLGYSAPGVDVVGGVFYQNLSEHDHFHVGYLLDGEFATGDPALLGVKFNSSQIYNDTIHDPTAAAFTDATIELVPTLKAFAGLRFTHEKLTAGYDQSTNFDTATPNFNPITLVDTAAPISTFSFAGLTTTENNVSGRVGIQWEPAHGMDYYASYNRGYKGPAINPSGGITSTEGYIVSPETAYAYEVGAKQRFFDDRLAIDLSVYYQEIENIQQTGLLQTSKNLNTTLINAGTLITSGFDLGVSGRLASGLTLNGGVVYNDARYGGKLILFPCGPTATPGVGNCDANGVFPLNGEPAIGSPEWKFVTSMDSEQPLNGRLNWFSHLGYVWQSKVQFLLYQDPINEQGSYGLLDASLGVGSADGRWRVTAFGKNLTNKFFYAGDNTANGFIGEQFIYLSRDFQRYGGVRLSVKF
jgi:iron complex outermembrane recepter protein